MKQFLRILLDKNLHGVDRIKTLLFKYKHNIKSNVLIYKKSNLHIENDVSINISNDGFLYLNIGWIFPITSWGVLRMRKNTKLEVNGAFKIYSGVKISIKKNAILELGSGYINSNCNINCAEKIVIGHHVAIGENVVIRDSDSHRILSNKNYRMTQPIIIEDHVWIGINVTILKGVRVGKGSVIAAGAVVNKDIPPNVLAGGVPAKILKENVNWK